MKNLVIISTLALGAFFFGTNNAAAQNNTATTTVNIILADVISIDAGSVAIGGEVAFNYVTAADYNTDTTINVPNSLKVTSTKNFDIKVKADGANFTNGTNNIPVNVLTIKPVAGGTTTMTGTPANIVLTTSDQTLISNATLGSAVVLELDYLIPAARSSSTDILGKPAGTYTQTVTYTATAL
ncbi:peptidoglycan-binding protein LysM [Aequorivita flava]|uniref:Peptidoglycan-binding protein LysM n=1 Tax=Aequorivita flava TaxID=3114371 RepID=A0AB35YUX5_9FLAO